MSNISLLRNGEIFFFSPSLLNEKFYFLFNQMALQISPQDTEVLLKQKNIVTPDVVAKYNFAGQVSQTCLQYIVSLINDSYHLGLHDPYSAAELCLLGDSFMKNLINKNFKKYTERGIAQPVSIDVNDIVVGYSPELDDETNITFQPGDIVTVSLGCHIDGYTANLSHTIVIYPQFIDGKAPAPLLGVQADSICATHLATESVLALLGCSLSPEKIPNGFTNGGSAVTAVTGEMIRNLVDSIAESFNCVVVPTSKVRRIRRFLAGQAEGVVAERDFKGVVWSEADQEKKLLNRGQQSTSKEIAIVDTNKGLALDRDNSMPTDDFVVVPGEVYSIDIKMCPLNTEDVGIVTLESLDPYTGKNLKSDFSPKHSIFIRDVSVVEQLKLKASRRVVHLVEKSQSVYPFKATYLSEHFPLNLENGDIVDQLALIQKDMSSDRLGIQEAVNKHVFQTKPILAARFLPLRTILQVKSATGQQGYDAETPTLPGMEIPLPQLKISSLKLKTMMSGALKMPVARETTTVVLDSTRQKVIRLTGGMETAKVSWVHSEFQLQNGISEAVSGLSQLVQDSRFGVNVDTCRPIAMGESMDV